MSDQSTIVSALNQAHHEAMNQDENVVVLGEDVAVNGGVFRVTEGLLEDYGEERVMDTPLSEGGIVGTAIGMASFGLKPIAEIQFSGFLHPAMDQLVSHLSRLRTRTRGEYTCPVVVRAPYTGGIKAPEHHSESLESIYAHIPGLKVVSPSSPSNARNMLHGAIRDPDPVLFLEPKRIYRSLKEELEPEVEPIEPGSARRVRSGDEVTIVSWGAMLRDTLRVVKDEFTDRSFDVIDLRSLSPIDREIVIESVESTGRAVIVQEAPRTSGLASELTAIINEEAFLHLEAPVKRVTGFDTVMPLAKMEETYLPGKKRISRAIREVLDF